MRALIQRVHEASVSINDSIHSRIGKGLLIFLGVTRDDTTENASSLAIRCANLRIFEDAGGKMNLSVKDVEGEVLIVSQFTLYADTQRGNRPSFTDAARPEIAETLYEAFVSTVRDALAPHRVHTGMFRAMMDVSLVNNGPVTILLESKKE